MNQSLGVVFRYILSYASQMIQKIEGHKCISLGLFSVTLVK